MGVFRKLIGGAATLLVMASNVSAADVTLTISSWAPPTHGLNAQMWPNLIKMIEEATDGRVTAEVKYKLASPPAQMDLILDGAADMSVIFHGYQSGRFAATKLIELPGYDGNAEAASVAYWRVYEQHLSSANEHRGVKVVGLHTHGPAQLHSNTKVTSLDAINGLKVRVPGGVGSLVGEALGATGIKVPAPKVYETLASNAADGVVMPFESRGGFKLTEVARNVFEMPGGFYRGSFAFIMNQETFDGLPEDIRKVLDEKVFGEPASRMAGAVWDNIDQRGRVLTEETADNSVTMASEADATTYKALAEPIVAGVLEEVAAKGIDAKAAREMILAEMKKAK
ncbi:MAG: TRAP transporter substrate-binding protein [Pseudomonadota bacterium]